MSVQAVRLAVDERMKRAGHRLQQLGSLHRWLGIGLSAHDRCRSRVLKPGKQLSVVAHYKVQPLTDFPAAGMTLQNQ